MYVLVKHEVLDQDAFFGAKGKEFLSSLPKDVTLHNSYALQGGSEAICVWEAESIDRLRNVMDAPTQGIAKNTYFEVDPQRSQNLPQLRRAA